jgi:hypothetical protein
LAQKAISDEDLAQADTIDWTQENESWNSYRLSDGTLLKIKLALKDVKSLKKYMADGTPIYFTTYDILIRTTEVPDSIKQKPNAPSTL